MGIGGGRNTDYSSSPSSSSSSSGFWSSALRAKRLVSPAEKAAQDNAGRGLSRRLGVFDLVLLGIGASIGAGIFVITGTVARDAGPGMPPFSFSFLSFVFNFYAAVICLKVLLLFSEMLIFEKLLKFM